MNSLKVKSKRLTERKKFTRIFDNIFLDFNDTKTEILVV